MKLSAREKMAKWKDKKRLTYQKISEMCNVSPGLISCIEGGWVTHPDIVKRLQKVYGLTDLEAEELLPVNRRPHGGDYDPDRYVVEPNLGTARIMPKPEALKGALYENKI